ncbi:hypothetical protein [Pedobacter sp. GR22-10]|uniref:hypothetical protein n=1 Tax=Pedobacter sp. GR22-10 TaxID=2994472 RepID=UPI0022470DD7|nr:hypothetical protein [Pedobacter sp. GR22-10]MCX2431106.1 hypothetical protein [Pedobacter sp. GR22-10]
MKRTVLFIVALVHCIVLYGQESKLSKLDSNNGFNNLKFRSSIGDIKKIANLKKISEAKVKDGVMEYYSIKNADRNYTFGNYKLKSISLGFVTNHVRKTEQLAYIEVNLADSKYLSDSGKLNEMLNAEYGFPTKTESEEKNFELSQNHIAYVLDWQADKVLLRLLKWNLPLTEKGEIVGNTYRYYDLEIFNNISKTGNNGF